MIDPKFLRERADAVRASQARRGESTELVDEVVAADGVRRSSIAAFESLRAEQKSLGREISRAGGDERTALLERTRKLAAAVKLAEAEAGEADARFTELARGLSNLVADEAPTGSEADFVVLDRIGKPRDFAAEGFEPKDHVELGRLLGAIDIERGAKVSGARFYYLTGVGAQLELALVNLAMAQAAETGFTAMIPPALVRPRAMEGTGFLGQAADDVYYLPADDLYLVGTSEVPLAAYHMDELLDPDELPLRYAGVSPCYRREAGSYGKDTTGIIRVHWFDKVEMFSLVPIDQAAAEHQRLLQWEKDFLGKLELAFQVIDVASGDLGLSAERKFDCEAWIPTQGRYRELTSTSNCTDFQARRLNIRTRTAEGPAHVATLNGTLCAMARTIVALLETHQQPDGSVRVPDALQPYLGGRQLLEPVVR